jgi:hypothetical protein
MFAPTWPFFQPGKAALLPDNALLALLPLRSMDICWQVYQHWLAASYNFDLVFPGAGIASKQGSHCTMQLCQARSVYIIHSLMLLICHDHTGALDFEEFICTESK